MPLTDKTCKHTEYYTPPRILDPVKDYFGAIDLDPATSRANPTGALHYYVGGEYENGLLRTWNIYQNGGTAVFVNPPYGRELKQWVRKLSLEAHGDPDADKNPPEIIALLPGQRFEQLYWQEDVFNPNLTAFCMVRKRLSFLDEHGMPIKGNPYGSFVYLYNGNWEHFADSFAAIGKCVKVSATKTRVES